MFFLKKRPTVITILAILEAIFGFLSLIGGLGISIISPLMSLAAIIYGSPEMMFHGWALMAAGAVLMLLGFLMMFVAWGFWTGHGWAWTVGVILSIVGMILSLLRITSGGIIGLIINGIILYYLFRPDVKEFFGKL